MQVAPLKLLPVGAARIEGADKPAAAADGKSFGQVFSEALGEVNRLQQNAEQASLNLAAGKVQDVSEVVIAAEKATVALQLTMQVRNKIVDAYKEVMQMQV